MRYPWPRMAYQMPGVVHRVTLDSLGAPSWASARKAAQQWGYRHGYRVEIRFLGDQGLMRWTDVDPFLDRVNAD